MSDDRGDRDRRALSKRFGRSHAVKDLSFEVAAGRVTGFLGPNGAGKSTTLRMLLGLDPPRRRHAPPSPGARYDELPHPSATVGAVLEDASFHPGRSGPQPPARARRRRRAPDARVEEVLEQVGLADAADRRVKGYSMGMRQRLAIAAALLGDPEVLILDEPANGLDPPGIRWMRDLLRAEAARGRAVLVSSHLLSEVAQSVDDVVVIADGSRRAAGPLESVLGCADGPTTRVRSAEPGARLRGRCANRDIEVESGRSGGTARARRDARARWARSRRPSRVALAELVGGLALARGRLLRAHRGDANDRAAARRS